MTKKINLRNQERKLSLHFHNDKLIAELFTFELQSEGYIILTKNQARDLRDWLNTELGSES